MTRRRRNIIPGHTPPALRQLVLVALVSGLCSLMGGVAPAEARQTPQNPTRLITQDYAPDALFALRLAPDRVAQIVFPTGEEVLHAALGRAADVELAADGRVMFLRPRTPQMASNLLVTTRRGSGELRHYAFDLSTRTGPPLYRLVLRDAEAEAATALAAIQTALQAALAALPPAPAPATPAPSAGPVGTLNADYRVVGSEALEPDAVVDDGERTWLRFRRGRPLPSLYVVAPDGEDRIATFEVRGEWIVLPHLTRHLRLRADGDQLCIFHPDAGTA